MSLSPEPKPLLYTVEESTRALRLSRSTMCGLIADGSIETVKIGRSRRIPAVARERFIEGLVEASRP